MKAHNDSLATLLIRAKESQEEEKLSFRSDESRYFEKVRFPHP